MQKLLAGIEAKREAIFTGRPETIDASLPDELEPMIAQLVARAESERVARRVWSKDDTLWGQAGQAEVADRLGWLNAHETYGEQIDELEAFAADAAAAGYTDTVLLGMGGSSLAPEVLRRSFGSVQHDRLRLHVLDSHRSRRGACPGARRRPRHDAVSRLDEVRRDDRDDLAVRALLGAAPARRAVRRDHRPGLVAGDAGRAARLPAHVPQRPRRRRALQRADVLRARAGGAHGRRPRCAARGRRRRRRGLRGRLDERGQQRAVARRRARRAGECRAATSSRSSSTRRSRRSGSGSSSSSPSRPASTARASCP